MSAASLVNARSKAALPASNSVPLETSAFILERPTPSSKNTGSETAFARLKLRHRSIDPAVPTSARASFQVQWTLPLLLLGSLGYGNV